MSPSRTRRRTLKQLSCGLAAPALAPLLMATPAAAQPQPSPHAIEIPRWFSNSLLDFKDEIPEAAREGKRVMVYFGQDGCPYCKALMKASFGPGPITDKTRQHFVAIARMPQIDAFLQQTMDDTTPTAATWARLRELVS